MWQILNNTYQRLPAHYVFANSRNNIFTRQPSYVRVLLAKPEETLFKPKKLSAQYPNRLVSTWLTRDYSIQGAKLIGTTLIPQIAIREAIINALVHRKYSIPGAIKIALYDNRLEIFSPGNFPGLVDINNLGDGTTYLRNPNLVMLVRKMGLVEKLGSGIRMMFESCRAARIHDPEFKEDGDFVKVIFHIAPATDPSLNDDEKILQLLKIQGVLQIEDVVNLLQVSRNTATRKLNKLLESNKLLRTGSGPSVRYLLKNS